MKKQWYKTLLLNMTGRKCVAERLMLFLNEHNLQPGEVIVLPVVHGESPNPIIPILYFAEKSLPTSEMYD